MKKKKEMKKRRLDLGQDTFLLFTFFFVVKHRQSVGENSQNHLRIPLTKERLTQLRATPPFQTGGETRNEAKLLILRRRSCSVDLGSQHGQPYQ